MDFNWMNQRNRDDRDRQSDIYCESCGDYVGDGCDNKDCKYFKQLKQEK